MDKEIYIDDKRNTAELWYTWKSTRCLFTKKRKLLAAKITIKPNRAQTLSEIARRLERVREINSLRRQHKRDIWRAKYNLDENP